MVLRILRYFPHNLNVFKRFYYRDILREKISLPVITMPLHLARKTAKFRARKLERLKKFRQMYGVDPERDPVIIRCENEKRNHYLNQNYPPNRPILLGTQSWDDKRYAGETLVINQRSRLKAVFFPKDIPFEEFNLCDEVLRILRENSFTRATDVQSLVIPKMLANDTNAIVAAETGSGKTLAYLIPLINNLHLCREQFGAPKPFLPRAVIFAPSRELSSQIYQILNQLIYYTKLSAVHLSSNDIYPKALENPTDIIIGTPGRVQKFKRAGMVRFKSLLNVIIDEADTLLDDTFRSDMQRLLQDVDFRMNATDLATQLMLISATFPEQLDEFLDGLADLDNFEQLTTANLHVLQPHVIHRFVRLTKPMLPEQILIFAKKEVKTERNSLIFVNDVETGYFLMHLLRANYVDCDFLFRDTRKFVDSEKILNKFRCERTKILIATDLGSRGLDLTNVQHVINYNFPKTLSGYIHRAGRLGRLGSKQDGGFVTSFICDGAHAAMVNKIETSVRLNEKLPDISLNVRKEYFEKKNRGSNANTDTTEE